MNQAPLYGRAVRSAIIATLALAALAAGGCSPGTGQPAGPAAEPGRGPASGSAAGSSTFALRSGSTDPVLFEGDSTGLTLPLSLERAGNDATPITLSLEGRAESDIANVSHAFDTNTLDADGDTARLTIRLAIGERSIQPRSRRFLIVASDGTRETRTPVEVAVEPVNAPDVYLLIGQSNMIGSSGEATRDASPGGPDEPNPRVLQLNVTSNDPFGPFSTPEAYTNPEANVVDTPIVVAEDPLHVPRDPARGGEKGFEYIGLGLTFGKSALADTTRNVVLVPAGWSGSAFCDNDNDPLGHWNAAPSDVPELGNTLLFDRARLRTDIALAETGGILRGILWHQGESDANLPCASRYAENLDRLAGALRTRIAQDRRGPEWRKPDARIPFIVGTMSRGFVDGSNDYRVFNDAKQMIDDVHKDIANVTTHAAVANFDDLVPENGYPCGTGDCIHFGARALREMGVRYHEAIGRALAPR